MRLQKLLAAAGFGSRRACEDLIRAGCVTVNGVVPELGYAAKPNDVVCVNGKQIGASTQPIYIALHKPVGFISDQGSTRFNRSAIDLVKLPHPQRLFPVGRLDKDSSGLLLLTNDGDLAYQLTHPKFEHEKEYWAWVDGVPNALTLRRWRQGVLLSRAGDDAGEALKTAPCQVDVLSLTSSARRARRAESLTRESDLSALTGALPQANGRTWLRIVLHEGRKRQIRRVAKQLGHPVVQLMRVRIGSLGLGSLKPAEWRQLSPPEVAQLSQTLAHT